MACCSEVSIQPLSTFAAVFTTPCSTTPGKGDAERALVVEIRRDLAGRLGDGLRGGGLRGVQPEPVADQHAAAQVDDAALDAGAADVDTEAPFWLRLPRRAPRRLSLIPLPDVIDG